MAKVFQNIKNVFTFQGLPEPHLALIYEEGIVKDLPLRNRNKNITMPQLQKSLGSAKSFSIIYHIYGAFYKGKLVFISSSPDKNVFNFYPDENRIEVIPDSTTINHHVPLINTDGLQIGDWFWIYGGNENNLNKQSEMNTSLCYFFFNFAETFFMESPLPPESRMVHIIEIGCAQNCHKALENWAKIGLFDALGGRIFKKTHIKQKITSFERSEYLLSLLRS